MLIRTLTKLLSAATYSDPTAKNLHRTSRLRLHHSREAKSELCGRIHSMLCGDTDDSPDSDEHLWDVPWLPTISQRSTSLRRKEFTRFRRQESVFNSSQRNRFGLLLKLCTHKLGTNDTINVFGRLGRETGVKEFNAMIEVCIQKARNTDDEDVALEEFHRAYMIFETMRERGFTIGEETYGPFLMLIIDKGMIEEFHFFYDNIKKENPTSLTRLAYYAMLLWIKVGNADKIRMLLADTDGSNASNFNGKKPGGPIRSEAPCTGTPPEPPLKEEQGKDF